MTIRQLFWASLSIAVFVTGMAVGSSIKTSAEYAGRMEGRIDVASGQWECRRIDYGRDVEWECTERQVAP